MTGCAIYSTHGRFCFHHGQNRKLHTLPPSTIKNDVSLVQGYSVFFLSFQYFQCKSGIETPKGGRKRSTTVADQTPGKDSQKSSIKEERREEEGKEDEERKKEEERVERGMEEEGMEEEGKEREEKEREEKEREEKEREEKEREENEREEKEREEKEREEGKVEGEDEREEEEDEQKGNSMKRKRKRVSDICVIGPPVCICA